MPVNGTSPHAKTTGHGKIRAIWVLFHEELTSIAMRDALNKLCYEEIKVRLYTEGGMRWNHSRAGKKYRQAY
jgi:hypothetical protein